MAIWFNRVIFSLILCLSISFVGIKHEVFSKSNAMFDEGPSYLKMIEEGQYKKALKEISKIRKSKLTVPQKKLKNILEAFQQVDAKKPATGLLIVNDRDVPQSIINKVKFNYKQAQKLLLDGNDDIAQDILIYNQYIYSGHFKSQQLMDIALGMVKGSYKISNSVQEYHSSSNTYFYGGNYLLAEKDLLVLAILDRENPQVFEKLGSTYYMMNKKQKALDQWTMALMLDPKNKELRKIIAQTKTSLYEEAKNKLVKQSQEKIQQVVIKDPQIMGVYKSQSKAFEYSEMLKKRGLKVLIEVTDSQKWKVVVSREALMKLNKKK